MSNSIRIQRSTIPFVFIRNVSDPLIAWLTTTGELIDENARDDFSSKVYDEFELYTANNGALAAWGVLASNALP